MSTIHRSLVGAFHALCMDADTPRSLAAWLLFDAEEWDQLVSLEIDPMDYPSPDTYLVDARVTAFFRKCEDLETTFDRKAVALENFWKCERECYRANERLSPFVFGAYAPGEERIAGFLRQLRKEASIILGRAPHGAVQDGFFGPGATFADRGQYTTVPDKMSSNPTLTPDSWIFLSTWKSTAWARACAESGRDLSAIRGNRFTTVPKDCKKHRGIAVEPSINLFYQLGLGRVVRRRLKLFGIDLKHGQDVHRRVACEASIKGHLCTEDLSNASDTICSNLVKLLLPTEWYSLFEALRSPFTLVEKQWVKLEKFSSMGNGFTFELETLLFLCIIRAVAAMSGKCLANSIDVYVYGDDIIFPVELVEDVNAALRFLGLTVNEAKSFVSGPFRESCGGDYFEGTDVRPFFLKQLPYEPQHFIAIANGIRRVGSNDPAHRVLDSRCRRAWFRILDALPSAIRQLRGPEELGDLVIHDDPSTWRFRTRNCIRYIGVYRPSGYREVAWSNFKDPVVLASALYGVGKTERSITPMSLGAPDRRRGVIPRDAVRGYKVGWTPYS